MIKTVQDKLFPFHTANKDFNEDITAIIELSDEETDHVAGGPEVQNDPNDH